MSDSEAAAGGMDQPFPPELKGEEARQQQGQEAQKKEETQEEDGEEEQYRVMAEGYKDEGNAAFKEGRYKEAIALYTQGLDIDPDNHVLYSNRSAAYLKEQERGKALKDAEKLMEIKPDWPKSYSRKGAAQHALTRYALAIETYQDGIALFPTDKALVDGLKAAEEAYNIDKQARFEQAKRERETAEHRKKKEAEAKAAAENKEKEAEEPPPTDDLASFFSLVGATGTDPKQTISGANVQRDVKKALKEDYAKADLGTSESQIARLLQPNYSWKNLNPYSVLSLGIDATEDDIKLRYRKLSTLVHPDKCLEIEEARDAFEEVKKAYNQLMDEERRAWCIATIQQTQKRTIKDRKHKLSKGMTLQELGSEQAAIQKAIMMEFAEVEMRKKNAEKHAQAFKQYEQQMEDEERLKQQREMEFDATWTAEDRREGRVGNWRDFQKGPGAKRAKVQSWTVEENAKNKPKFGQSSKDEWKKNWK